MLLLLPPIYFDITIKFNTVLKMYRVVNRALSSESLSITPINEYHKGIGGTMVPFAGYEMPVEYKDFSGGVKKEHLHCREHAGLFDVSHMG